MLIRTNDGERAVVPYYHPLSLMDEIDDFVGKLWSSWSPMDFTDSLMPRTDMYEEKGNMVIETELPGIEQKDLDVALENDMLTIKAEKKQEATDDTTRHSRERLYGKYYRTIQLPYPVKEAGVSAALDNGVLKITLPKAEAAKPKKIAVKTPVLKSEQKAKTRKTVKKAS